MQCWEYGRFVTGAITRRWSDGAQVKIVKQLEKTRSIAGYTDSLYEVQVGGAMQTLWGGELANAVYPLSDGSVFLARVVGTGTGKLRQVEARLHTGRNTLRFPTIEVQETDRFGYSLGVLASGGRGLAGVERIFRLKFTYEACDYPNGEVILLQRGSQLVLGPRALSSSNEVGSQTYKLVFPRDPGGRPNQIRELATVTERNENGKILRQKTTLTTHHWTGSRVIK
ncbi:hypothetical protein [Armatimonas sp.]|uniref:hypothetical protein n=1 Tax=Armatimonas sp. TaxID=1872638 RepID=UPI00286CCCF9|nr:hypothetical protein [Armatimonas sp.]